MRRFPHRSEGDSRALALILPAMAIVLIAATSAAAPSKQAGIQAGKGTVTYGNKIALHGTFPGAKRSKVDVVYRAAG